MSVLLTNTFKVKDLIETLKKFDENLDVVFYSDDLGENHWSCQLAVDDANGHD